MKALGLIFQYYVRSSVHRQREINISRRYQKFTLNQPPSGQLAITTVGSHLSKCAYIIFYLLLLGSNVVKAGWAEIIANYSRVIKRKLHLQHLPGPMQYCRQTYSENVKLQWAPFNFKYWNQRSSTFNRFKLAWVRQLPFVASIKSYFRYWYLKLNTRAYSQMESGNNKQIIMPHITAKAVCFPGNN